MRGPLHGIPVVLKDNFNTFDMPTTAGSQLLMGSIPPSDAFLTKKLGMAEPSLLPRLISANSQVAAAVPREQPIGDIKGRQYSEWLQLHGRPDA